MARDPIQHEPELLQEGLRRVVDGDELDDTPTVRDELLHLGLVLRSHDGRLIITREGRAFAGTTT